MKCPLNENAQTAIANMILNGAGPLIERCKRMLLSVANSLKRQITTSSIIITIILLATISFSIAILLIYVIRTVRIASAHGNYALLNLCLTPRATIFSILSRL